MKLLRVLQTGEFERLGSSETRQVDVRVICATNADLRQSIARGTFREDLYYRLNVIELHVPPLAERPRRHPAARRALPPAAQDASATPPATRCSRHAWPGNVRELKNRIQRAARHLRRHRHHRPRPRLRRIDRATDRRRRRWSAARSRSRALNANGSVSRAAEALGVSRQALYRRMEKLGIVLERRPK